MAIPGAALTKSYRLSDSMGELLRNTRKSGNGAITVGNGILNIYSPGIDEWCYAYLPIYAPRGTIIEVKFESRQYDANSNGKVLFDQKPGRADQISGFIDHLTPEGTNWKPHTVTKSGDHRKPYAYVAFGFNTPSVGRIHFRNITINVYNTMAPNPDVRMAMIRCEPDGNGWFLDDYPGRFTNVGVHGLEIFNDYVSVLFAPMQSSFLPICTAQLQYNGGRKDYHTAVMNDADSVRIYIIRSSTGEIVNPRQMTVPFMIGFTAHAF